VRAQETCARRNTDFDLSALLIAPSPEGTSFAGYALAVDAWPMTETLPLATLPDPIDAPLATLAGATPPGPGWFADALDHTPQHFAVRHEGAHLAARRWDPSGAPTEPPLLFIHGNGAHAGWWDFIAPHFAKTRACVAWSLSGMGDSEWRQAYSSAAFARETLAVAKAAGLLDGPMRPVLVAHSFGGAIAMQVVVDAPEAFALAVIVDTPAQPPDRTKGEGPPVRTAPNRVYPTLAGALARFRLAPRQPCENLWALDHIARGALKQVEGGWTWKFDPDLWANFHFDADEGSLIEASRTPMALIWGAQSRLMPPPVIARWRALAPKGAFVEIPAAEHHVLLDQPIAFVTALRGLLAAHR
jgi:pimeloyl-ACP methyl ester carboxylesterase